MSRKIYKFILATLLIIGFTFSGSVHGATGKEIAITNFSLTPNVVPTTSGGKVQFAMTLTGTINVTEFNNTCGTNHNKFAWYVYAGADFEKYSGEYTVNRTQNPLPFSVRQNIAVDVSAPESRGGTFDYYVKIYCSKGLFSSQLVQSGKIKITFGTASTTDKVWACIAGDNKYSCSPGNLSNVSDAPSCSGKTPIQIGKNLCGKDAGTGPAPNKTPTGETTGGGAPGKTDTFTFEIPNPLKGGADDLSELVTILAQWIFNLAIPIAVAMIVYAGILFLVGGQNPGKITQAKEILKWAVVGLAIIMIGSGFVTLIQSILELGSSNPPTP